MAYDQTHANVVLFGGIDASGQVLGDTWIWDGTNWTQRFPSNSPPARGYSSMAFDVQQNRALLFGGSSAASNAQAVLGDTWVWDGNSWTQLSPSLSPSARSFDAMAYDVGRDQIILFGGVTADSVAFDTWTWNGANWTQAGSAPGISIPPDLVYDSSLGTVLLHDGGLDHTWVWNGTNWVLQTGTTPPGGHGAISDDSPHGQVLYFGGTSNGTQYLNSTWAWSGGNWTLQSPAVSPSARGYMSMVYDKVRNEILMFGGIPNNAGVSFLRDTWAWGNSSGSDACVPDAISSGINFGDICRFPSTDPQWLKSFGDNSKLEVTCSWAYNDGTLGSIFPAPAYMAWYTNPHGQKNRIAQCLFSNGVNLADYRQGHLSSNAQATCLAAVDWKNLDGGGNDGPRYATGFLGNPIILTTEIEPYLDLVEYQFDANANKLSWADEKFNYPNGIQYADDSTLTAIVAETLKPVPNLTYSVDPFVGAETESVFDQVWTQLQSEPRGAMKFVASCDLNADGRCDDLDLSLLANATGKCQGQSGYISRVDLDGDGCVTAIDVAAAKSEFQAYHAGCTYSQGFWKTHEDRWPVNALKIGNESYTQGQLMEILKRPVQGNGAIDLAHQLIAAELNVASGASASAAQIVSANALLLNLAPGKLPPIGTASISTAQTSSYVSALGLYNEGLVGPPSCSQ